MNRRSPCYLVLERNAESKYNEYWLEWMDKRIIAHFFFLVNRWRSSIHIGNGSMSSSPHSHWKFCPILHYFYSKRYLTTSVEHLRQVRRRKLFVVHIDNKKRAFIQASEVFSENSIIYSDQVWCEQVFRCFRNNGHSGRLFSTFNWFIHLLNGFTVQDFLSFSVKYITFQLNISIFFFLYFILCVGFYDSFARDIKDKWEKINHLYNSVICMNYLKLWCSTY